jgi:MoxR-like ATPase
LVRLQCYEGIDASQALYEWDHARQLLHVRAVETSRGDADRDQLEAEIYDRRFLIERPLLRALSLAARVGEDQAPPVLLIDELDRADDEFEAFLLELLAEWSVTIPELGTIESPTAPLTVITSNRTRDVHDALKRRCLYHWIEHPTIERERAILQRRVPSLAPTLAEDVAAAAAALRDAGLYKPPGVAESVDWAAALQLLGVERLDATTASATLGVAVKYHEDESRARVALAERLGRRRDGAEVVE